MVKVIAENPLDGFISISNNFMAKVYGFKVLWAIGVDYFEKLLSDLRIVSSK